MTQTLTMRTRYTKDQKLEINAVAQAIRCQQWIEEPREYDASFLQAGRQLPVHPRSTEMDNLHNARMQAFQDCAIAVVTQDWKVAKTRAQDAFAFERQLKDLMAEARANMRTKREFDSGSWNSTGNYWLEIEGVKFTFKLEIVWGAQDQKTKTHERLEVHTPILGLNVGEINDQNFEALKQTHSDLCRWILEGDTGDTRGRKLPDDDTLIFREHGLSFILRDAIELNYPHLPAALHAIAQTMKVAKSPEFP